MEINIIETTFNHKKLQNALKNKSILKSRFAHSHFNKSVIEVHVISCIVFGNDLNLRLTK